MMMISPNLDNNILSAMEDCVKHDRLSSMHFLTSWAIMMHWKQVVKGNNIVLVLLLNFQNVEPLPVGTTVEGLVQSCRQRSPSATPSSTWQHCISFCHVDHAQYTWGSPALRKTVKKFKQYAGHGWITNSRYWGLLQLPACGKGGGQVNDNKYYKEDKCKDGLLTMIKYKYDGFPVCTL